MREAQLLQMLSAAFGTKAPLDRFMLFPDRVEAGPVDIRSKHLAQQAAFKAIATKIVELPHG